LPMFISMSSTSLWSMDFTKNITFVMPMILWYFILKESIVLRYRI